MKGDRQTVTVRHSQRPERLSTQVIELTAARLRLIAEPKRIALLEALNTGEAGVQELADRIGAPHQNVSHHMALLHKAGMVSRRREGPSARYSVTDWSAWWVVEQIGRWVESCLEDQQASD
jgi:DNA-binding transcriptional ArsR family regulator